MSGSHDHLLPVVTTDPSGCTAETKPAGHLHGDACCSSVAAATGAAATGAAASGATCSTPAAAPAGGSELTSDEEQMIEALRGVIDPELMINIVDLGLVYTITQGDEGKVHVDMTLTSPSCPAGPQIVHQSKTALEQLPGVTEAKIRIVMSPPWTPARMTDDARDQLGIF